MLNNQTVHVTCPSCNAQFPLTETLAEQLEAQIKARFEAEHRKAELEIASREKAVANREAQSEAEITKRVAAEAARIKAQAEAAAAEKVGGEVADLRAQLVAEQQKRKEAEAQELELRKKKRELEEAQQHWEVEKARTLEADRQRIRDEEAQRATEAAHRQIAERDLKIKQLSDQAEILKRKADQGPIQQQGETLELELQAALTGTFKFDDIVEVKTGSRGGDWLQHVRPVGGACAGIILWETKRALNWSNDWPVKSKQDAFEAGATLAVIVSEVLPKGIEHFGQTEGGVWVTKPEHAVSVACALRQTLIETARVQAAIEGRATKAEALWDYVTGPAFKVRVEGALEAYRDLVEDHHKEKTATQRRWAKREKTHERLVLSLTGIAGDIQGLGGSEVPAIGDSELLALETSDEEVV